MSTYDDLAGTILAGCATAAEVRYKLAQATRQRLAATPVGHRASACPSCGQGVKKKLLNPSCTLFVCIYCGWNQSFPFAMDEATILGDAHLPGVTGQARGEVILRFDASGRLLPPEGMK